jgi:hypothetical protein
MVYVCNTVGPGSDYFTLEVHHGGIFIGSGENRTYIDEKVDWFDYCEGEPCSPLWIEDFIGQLGYDKNYSALVIYWLLPGLTLAKV